MYAIYVCHIIYVCHVCHIIYVCHVCHIICMPYNICMPCMPYNLCATYVCHILYVPLIRCFPELLHAAVQRLPLGLQLSMLQQILQVCVLVYFVHASVCAWLCMRLCVTQNRCGARIRCMCVYVQCCYE